MNLDYSSILKADRVQPDIVATGPLVTTAEADLEQILFSPVFRRLQHQARAFPLDGNVGAKSSQAIETAHIGRRIARQIAARLESGKLASASECAALVDFTETACLAREVGCPPFDQAGEAAIQRWFVEHGPGKVQAACRHYGGHDFDDSDPRLVNALADFYEFDRNPQRLRVLAKLQVGNTARSLHLTKTSIASTLQYLRMAGIGMAETTAGFSDKPGFFSTEAGLVKNVWSSVGYEPEPQRFPISYIAEAAADIVSFSGDLQRAIDNDLLRAQDAIEAIKNDWLTTYIPIDPDPVDQQILDTFALGADGGFADARQALIAALCDYVARRYIDQHDAVFAGITETLLPTESGAGSMVAALERYCRQHLYCLETVQRKELIGYSVVSGLLDHFGVLLESPSARFQTLLNASDAAKASDRSLFVERKLLATIPLGYRNAYSHSLALLGHAHGRDQEFEEWNVRAHLLVDFIAGMDEDAATALHGMLSGCIDHRAGR